MSYFNTKGTTKSFFHIGGPSKSAIRTGTGTPDNLLGIDSDLFISQDQQELYIKRNGTWQIVTFNIINNYVRTEVNSSSYPILISDYYIGVNYNGEVTLTLPEGIEGKEYIIKDESGIANVNKIVILPNGSEEIDNDNGIELKIKNGSLTLLFSGGMWRIV